MTNAIGSLYTKGFTFNAPLPQLPTLKPVQPYSTAIQQATTLTHVNGRALHAAAHLLTGQVSAAVNSTGTHLTVTRGASTVHLRKDDQLRVTLTVTDLDLTTVAAALLLDDLLTPGDHPLRDHLRALPLPLPDLSVIQADATPVEQLTAHLETLLRQAGDDATLTVEQGTLSAPHRDATGVLYGAELPLSPTVHTQPDQLSAPASVQRWIESGLNVLLTGPTATFKTTTAVDAATATGAYIVMIAGRPGLEDRDLFGGIYPTESGPRFIDGPVTEAFVKASQGVRTVLILNELTRFEPLYLGAMIGALDDVPAHTLTQMGVQGLHPQDPRRYYALRLPHGDLITAPTTHLSVIATTNLGSDYVTANTIDAALLRRFDRHLDLPHADLARTTHLIAQRCPDPHLAHAAATLELHTRSEVQGGPGGEGLLARELNPTVSANLAQEAHALTGLGLNPAQAFITAAATTAVPFCTPRTPSGHLDPAAQARLLDLIREVASTL